MGQKDRLKDSHQQKNRGQKFERLHPSYNEYPLPLQPSQFFRAIKCSSKRIQCQADAFKATSDCKGPLPSCACVHRHRSIGVVSTYDKTKNTRKYNTTHSIEIKASVSYQHKDMTKSTRKYIMSYIVEIEAYMSHAYTVNAM